MQIASSIPYTHIKVNDNDDGGTCTNSGQSLCASGFYGVELGYSNGDG